MSARAGGRAPAHPAVVARRRQVARDRGRRRRSGVLWLLGTAALAAGLYWLLTGPVLAVDGVRLAGYDREDRPALVAALEAAASEGTVLSPTGREIASAADAFPWVGAVEVERDWPRGLRITVTPAVPAVVAASRTAAVLVSGDGRVLGPVEGPAGVGWLRLVADPPAVGGTLPPEALPGLALARAAAPRVSRRLRAVEVDASGILVGRVAGGPALVLGSPTRIAAKARALALVLGSLTPDEERAASEINLSVPERPAVGGLPTP